MTNIIIDAHCHAASCGGPNPDHSTGASFSLYLQRAARAGITNTVVFAPLDSDYAQANARTARLVARWPARLLGIAFVHATRDRGRIGSLVQTAVRSFGFRGIKVHRSDAPITREICDVARRLALPIIYDPFGDVGHLDALASEYSDVTFIIPHLGSFWDRTSAQIAFVRQLCRWPNIYTDTSGVRHFDILKRAVNEAGPSKVLFGTDGPWLHPAVELAKVYALVLPRKDQRLILAGNARRIYRGVRSWRPLLRSAQL